MLTIILVGAAVAGLALDGQISTNRAIDQLRRDVAGLRERMARPEGLFEGFTRAVPPDAANAGR